MQKLLSARNKRIASILVLILTAVLFAYYIRTHPQLITNIKSLSLATIFVILIFYSLVVLTNAAILHWSVQICGKFIHKVESMLLTSYSTLVNFFGPLQSGPGFRAIYLKNKHGVTIKSYGIATILYYAAFGIFSLLMVSYGLEPMLALLAFVLLLAATIVGCVYLSRKYPELLKNPSQIVKIVAMTALQILCTTTIYYLELRTVNRHISLSQAFVYTGAANLALFVSLTPGAIGFRESFLLFSERLHHINTHDVLAASVIDRSVYFVFLGFLFLATTAFHAKDKLKKSTA